MPVPPHTPLELAVATRIAIARGLDPNAPVTIGLPPPDGGEAYFEEAWIGYLPLAQALIEIVQTWVDPGP